MVVARGAEGSDVYLLGSNTESGWLEDGMVVAIGDHADDELRQDIRAALDLWLVRRKERAAA